ncbi:hypothetical protein GW17_00019377 [Ensete ventricosum]|nr:hypothetical protein GW17_00019377 [Ensete ventricosum]
MMAVYTGDETAAAAVAVCGGRGAGRSRRAVRWAAEHLVPHAHRVVLVHVIPAVTSIPSPCVPLDRLSLLLSSPSNPTTVETLVLEGENPAAALLEYVSDSGIKNLVLGYSSFSFRRLTMYIILVILLLADASISTRIQTINGKLFVQRCRNSLFDAHFSLRGFEVGNSPILSFLTGGTLHTQALSEPSPSISVRSFETLPSIGVNEEGELTNRILEVRTCKNYGFLDSIRYKSIFRFHLSRKVNKSLPPSHSNLQDVSSADVSNSRQESQNILVMYNQVCDDLVHAKKKV